MCHDASQFSFVVGSQDQAGIDIEEASGQRECIDLIRIHHLDSERHKGIGVPHQVLTNTIDEFGNCRIGDEFGGSFDLLGKLLAHLDLLFQAIPVPQTASATHIAVTDGIDISDAASLRSLDRIIGRFTRDGILCCRKGASKNEEKCSD